jgi:hypothetical protein
VIGLTFFTDAWDMVSQVRQRRQLAIDLLFGAVLKAAPGKVTEQLLHLWTQGLASQPAAEPEQLRRAAGAKQGIVTVLHPLGEPRTSE